MPAAQLFSIEDMNQAADALGVDVTTMNGSILKSDEFNHGRR